MDDLLIKYILEETTPEESEQVLHWLAADAGNQAHFEKLQQVWQLAAQPNSRLTTDTPQALQRLKQTLQTKQPAPVKRIWARIGTAAAAIVGFAGVVLGAYVIIKPTTPAKKATPVAKPDTVRLKRLPVDTIPLDTIPVVQPIKKKLRIPATPVQPVRTKMKAVQPIPAVDSIQPVPTQTKQRVPVMKKRLPVPVMVKDTAFRKKKLTYL